MDRIDHLITIGEAILTVLNELKEKDEIPMTRSQAAVYLGVSPTTITNYINKGILKPSSRHGITGYLPSDLKRCKK